MAAVFTALTAVSAFVAIPVGSVPFTLQVYVVLLTGLVLGARIGALSVLAYLILGLVRPSTREARPDWAPCSGRPGGTFSAS